MNYIASPHKSLKHKTELFYSQNILSYIFDDIKCSFTIPLILYSFVSGTYHLNEIKEK